MVFIVFGKLIGDEFVNGGGLDDGFGEDVGVDFVGFFEEEDVEVVVVGGVG